MNLRGKHNTLRSNDVARNIRGKAAGSVDNRSRDLIPGINVRNAVDQVMPWNWGKNLDVFDNYSTNDGPGDERVPIANPDGTRPKFGRTDFSASQQLQSPVSSTQDVSNALNTTNANSVYTPGNNLSYRDAQERANTIGQWEDELAYINSKLSNLDAARKTAQNTINDNFNIQDQRLDQQKAVADQRYNRHRNETKRSFMENRDANAAQSRDMYQSVMRLLGRGGAGSSSTANILAPHAIAQDSSKKNALIADTYRKDVEDIDEAANQAQVDYDNKKFDLSKWKKDQERDLNADTEAKRSDFLTKKAKAETNLGLARGDSWRRARSAANPTIAEREQVDRAISTLADSYRTPAPQKDLDVKDIKRKNYVVDTAGVSVDQPEGEETSNANYYLDRMEEERRRKSKKLGITPALNNN